MLLPCRSRLARLLVPLSNGEEGCHVLQAPRLERRFGGGERHDAGPPQLEQGPRECHTVVVDRRSVLSGRPEALGDPEREERVIADDGARRLELLHARAAALHDVERLREEEGAQGVVVRAERFADARELLDGAARLVRSAGAAHTVLEASREQLRRRAIARGLRGALCAREGGPDVARARRRLRRLEQEVALRAFVDPLALRDGVERVAEVVVGAERAGQLDAEVQCLGIEGAAPEHRGGVTHRCLEVARRERRPPGAELELVALVRVALDGGGAAPQRRGPRVLPLAIEEIRQVPQGARVVGPLAQQERELVAGLAHAAEALLEDRRATQAHRPQHLPHPRVRAQSLRAARQVIHELVVAVPRDDEGLDGVVRLLVVGVQRQNAPPRSDRGVEVAPALVRPGEPLEHRDTPILAHTRCDLVESRHARLVVARELGDALERAPPVHRSGIELARLEERADRAGRVAARFPPLGDLGPAVGAHRRQRLGARRLALDARLDLGALPRRVPRRAQLALDLRAVRAVAQVHGALEERCGGGVAALRDLRACGREERLHAAAARDAGLEALEQGRGVPDGGVGLRHEAIVVRVA